MGIRNFLVEGLSGTGKTSVCDELQRRGYQAIHGDRARGQGEGAGRRPGRSDDLLLRRLDARPDSEWGGRRPPDRELLVRLLRAKEDIPKNGILIDATAPIEQVVDEILRKAFAGA